MDIEPDFMTSTADYLSAASESVSTVASAVTESGDEGDVSINGGDGQEVSGNPLSLTRQVLSSSELSSGDEETDGDEDDGYPPGNEEDEAGAAAPFDNE